MKKVINYRLFTQYALGILFLSNSIGMHAAQSTWINLNKPFEISDLVEFIHEIGGNKESVFHSLYHDYGLRNFSETDNGFPFDAFKEIVALPAVQDLSSLSSVDQDALIELVTQAAVRYNLFGNEKPTSFDNANSVHQFIVSAHEKNISQIVQKDSPLLKEVLENINKHYSSIAIHFPTIPALNQIVLEATTSGTEFVQELMIPQQASENHDKPPMDTAVSSSMSGSITADFTFIESDTPPQESSSTPEPSNQLKQIPQNVVNESDNETDNQSNGTDTPIMPTSPREKVTQENDTESITPPLLLSQVTDQGTDTPEFEEEPLHQTDDPNELQTKNPDKPVKTQSATPPKTDDGTAKRGASLLLRIGVPAICTAVATAAAAAYYFLYYVPQAATAAQTTALMPIENQA